MTETRRVSAAALRDFCQAAFLKSGLTPEDAFSAADNLTTVTTATADKTAVAYGDAVYISVDVQASDGLSATDGTPTLYAMEAGSSAWVPVATGTYAGSDFYPVEPSMNTTYKVVYSGYTATTAYEDTYQPSESAPSRSGRTIGLSLR